MALAAMFPATALALPLMVGRKRRDASEQDDLMLPEGEEDPLVRDFTTRHQSELIQKDIAPSSCRQLIDDESNKHLILCPGLKSRSLNLILMDDDNGAADEKQETLST